MYKIYKIRADHVIDYAAEELKKYLRMMMPDGENFNILYNPEAVEGYRLGLMSDFGLDTSEAKDVRLDDILHICVIDVQVTIERFSSFQVESQSFELVFRFRSNLGEINSAFKPHIQKTRTAEIEFLKSDRHLYCVDHALLRYISFHNVIVILSEYNLFIIDFNADTISYFSDSFKSCFFEY